MNSDEQILVTTHVSRDFLQNTAYFSTLPKVIWEYISNSLDNPKDNLPIVVEVQISDSQMVISDNGEGLSFEGLRNFFTMHAENIKRKQGKRVRGRFGTGKCAAFGIANLLTLESTQEGIQNTVRLSRNDIESAKTGEPFPVQQLTKNIKVIEEDGTIVIIDDLNIRVMNQLDKAIAYVERHLSRYRQRATVTINGHICSFVEPLCSKKYSFSPPENVAEHIGNVELNVKISPTPLDKDNRGIDILSQGIWHETTLAGLENREFSNFLFGEIDVPILEEREWTIPPFDNTRNNMLNPQNPVVVTLLGWISEELEKVRLELVEEDKRRKASLESKKLRKEAKKIAEILNNDFNKMMEDFELAKLLTSKRGRTRIAADPSSILAILPGGGNEETSLQKAGQPHGDGTKGINPPGPGEEPRNGPSVINGEDKGSKREASQNGKRQRKGIFSIEYRNESAESHRSRYESDTRTIIVNLDHPQIASAYKSGNNNVESKSFREISYEVAGVEYALALPYERIRVDEFYDAAEALLDTRDTINRISRKFAEVLSQ